ncbi:MAG TPA: GNAT family N-acetyltransferase, partial [Acetobacteraceae bacterium]|nr:GNAT family N-acetyltransferase [Acetobacteraceae bacterium]
MDRILPPQPPDHVFGDHVLGNGPEIVPIARPAPGLLAAIAGPLAAFNKPYAGPANPRPLVLALQHRPGGETIGGLVGETIYRWLAIQSLYVPPELRRHGIGTALLRRAEAEAKARFCIGIVVNTFSFQARPFYERMGFVHFGTLEDCPPGHRC